MMTLLLLLVQVFLLLLLATTTEAINSFGGGGGGSGRNSLSAAAAASSRKFGIPSSSTTTTTTTTDDVAATTLQRRIVNLPRGGGWFGGGNGNNNNNNGNNKNKKQTQKKYPALSQLEIEEKLNVPVFGICSSNGQGIAIGKFNNDVVSQPPGGGPAAASPDQDMAYFFFDKQMAQQALQSMQSANPHIKLQLATLSLGKIWFRLLENQDEQLLDCSPLINNNDGDNNKKSKKNKKINKKKVSFRLVAGAKEFFLAKLLTSLTPMEAQELKMAVQENSKDKARDIVMKATQQKQHQQSNHPGSSTTFISPYNQIPLFMMPQLRVKLKDGEEEGEKPNDVSSSEVGNTTTSGTTTPKLPVFFSSKDMVKAYLGTQNANIDLDNLDSGMSITEFAASQQNQHNGQQPIIQLIELHELVKLMQEESDFDFRSMVLFTSSDDAADQDDNADYDDDDDDNDGGGGGDFPISASSNDDNNNGGGDDEVQIEMNIMMDDDYNDYLGGYSTNPLPM